LPALLCRLHPIVVSWISAELEGAAAAGEADRGTMAKLTDEQRRALRLPARSPNGCMDARESRVGSSAGKVIQREFSNVSLG
jgi:hypothetical protein